MSKERRISEVMEKIVDKVADVAKKVGEDDSFSFKDEFAKAQQKFLEKFPTHEHLIDLIDQLKDITDEEKEKLKQNIASRAMNAEKYKDMFTKKMAYPDYFLFIGMVMIITILFGENSICYQLFICLISTLNW